MKDRRTLVMIALLLVLGVAGAVYMFGGRDGSSGGGSGSGISMGSVAILILILLAVVSAGASRNKRVVRDEEERKDG